MGRPSPTPPRSPCSTPRCTACWPTPSGTRTGCRPGWATPRTSRRGWLPSPPGARHGSRVAERWSLSWSMNWYAGGRAGRGARVAEPALGVPAVASSGDETSTLEPAGLSPTLPGGRCRAGGDRGHRWRSPPDRLGPGLLDLAAVRARQLHVGDCVPSLGGVRQPDGHHRRGRDHRSGGWRFAAVAPAAPRPGVASVGPCPRLRRPSRAGWPHRAVQALSAAGAVSYTHLTLPTIYSV